MTNSKRNIGLDVLRIISCVMVILIHVVDDYVRAGNFGTHFLESFEVCVFLNSASRASVPIFLMISGLFLLDENRVVTKQKIANHIIKMIKAFLFGTLLYTFIDIVIAMINGDILKVNWIRLLKDCISGPFHFWYLYLIVGLYLITPILREITKNKEIFNMYMLLSIFFSVLLPSICGLPYLEKLSLLVNKAHLNFLTGYQLYFMLGYWISVNRFKISNKIVYIIVFFLNVFVCTFATIAVDNGQLSTVNKGFLDYFYITTFIEAVCLFKLFYDLNVDTRIEKIVSKISDFTFGVYILHLIFIKDYSGIYIIDWTLLGRFRIIGEVFIVLILCIFILICYSILLNATKCVLRKE